ncbi:MAG: hypothetical protein WBA51_12795 [Erythrobacter sp.]
MDISRTAQIVADQTAMLAQEMTTAASVADGVLANTAEVSATSQRSAKSMREAAETSMSLLQGFRSARVDFAVAARSAKSASDEAKESAGSVKMLEEQSK